MHCICHLHFALRERPITITIRGFHSFRRLKDVAEREREVDIFPARQTWRSHFKDERLGRGHGRRTARFTPLLDEFALLGETGISSGAHKS